MNRFFTRLTATAALICFAAPMAPALAVDKDCGDFASQRAAQIFFLNAGGPTSDSHGLDSDGDGIACESNPSPYYYGSTPPGGGGGGSTPTTTTASVKVDYVIDGDTVRLVNGSTVRLIGIDTAESGQCGFIAAKKFVERMVPASGKVTLVNPASVDNKDRYGRLLRYLGTPTGDPGRKLIVAGLADARYDSRDGYQWHPRQASYRAADAANPDRCG